MLYYETYTFVCVLDMLRSIILPHLIWG